MPNLHVFDYLGDPSAPAPVTVAYGGEPFLKSLAMVQLRDAVVERGTPFGAYEGAEAEWRDVIDELATVALFSSGRRLVVIEAADPFVSRYRSELEQYVAKANPRSTLLLDVESWAANTRLYKLTAEHALQIDCRPPERPVGKRSVLDEVRVCRWLVERARTVHQVHLEQPAAERLLELVGPQFGLLDQETAKLALMVDLQGTIGEQQVVEAVGGWQTKTVWQLLDDVAHGRAAESLRQLDRLLQAGEAPQALFGQVSWSLRRFAAATRIYQQAERDGRRLPLPEALKQAGFRTWPHGALAQAEEQLKQLGRERAVHIYRWLLEADLALKGSHARPDRSRLVLERLFVRLARQLSPHAAYRRGPATGGG